MIKAPIAGAIRGAIIRTIPIRVNTLAASFPLNISLAIAFAFTTISPPKKASAIRKIYISNKEVENIIIKLKKENPMSPKSEVFFLPMLTEIGPPKSCPKAKPNIKRVSVSSTFSIPTPNPSAIIGIEGV